jgi:ferrous iron transport protein A
VLLKLKITFMSLLLLPLATPARVVAINLDKSESARVRAIGVFEDEVVFVLRRAPFGGPLHVRTSSGGEFALDRAIAAAVEVDAEDMQEAAE